MWIKEDHGCVFIKYVATMFTGWDTQRTFLLDKNKRDLRERGKITLAAGFDQWLQKD